MDAIVLWIPDCVSLVSWYRTTATNTKQPFIRDGIGLIYISLNYNSYFPSRLIKNSLLTCFGG